jgi:hypothetical protein
MSYSKKEALGILGVREDLVDRVTKAIAKKELHLPVLRPRTALPMSQLAEDITALVWNELDRQGGCENLEAHRYPSLTHDLQEVLCRRINGCDAVVSAARDDVWAHTGGGAPTPAQRLPVCQEHAQRLIAYAGALLQDLLNAIEKTTRDFLSRHAPPFDNPLTQQAADEIHQAMETVVKPYLIQNLASPCCDTCEQARREG